MKLMMLLLAGLLLFGCKSRKTYSDNIRFSQVVPEAVNESKPDVLQKDTLEEQITVLEEQVTLTHGTDMMHYCIILGSFVNEHNAVDLRAALIKEGFTRSSIMQNKAGMFRVSAVCYNDESQARAELLKIPHQYPQHADAWLLITK